jgi:hypothetical protein
VKDLSGDYNLCHVVNDLGPTGIPGQIVAGRNCLGRVEIGILPWFGQSAFRGLDEIRVEYVGAQDPTI